MKFDILTIFPKALEPYTQTSMLKKAQDEGLVKIQVHDLRKWAQDKHKTVDDRPFGGGPGMVLKLEPIYRALEELLGGPPEKRAEIDPRARVFVTSVRGEKFSQAKAQELARYEHIILVAGHYEGIDERVIQHLADGSVSIGDYVLTGGELPALVILDAVVRLVPGVLEPTSLKGNLSREMGSLAVAYPNYTRPERFEVSDGTVWKVPEVLLSGNHARIAAWRKEHLKKIQGLDKAKSTAKIIDSM